MTEIVKKKELDNNTPHAKPGDHWLLLSKSAEQRNEFGRRVAPSSLNVVFSATSFHSPVGAGNTRIQLARVPTNDDGSVLSATLSTCTSIGTASYLNKAAIERMVEETPDASEVEGHFEIVQTIHGLSALEGISRRRLETFDHVHGFENCLIPAKQYGVCYVPKGQAAHLLVADGDVPDGLRFTHVLCDVLGTKHALLKRLGLDAAVETDKKLVKNSLELLGGAR